MFESQLNLSDNYSRNRKQKATKIFAKRTSIILPLFQFITNLKGPYFGRVKGHSWRVFDSAVLRLLKYCFLEVWVFFLEVAPAAAIRISWLIF